MDNVNEPIYEYYTIVNNENSTTSFENINKFNFEEGDESENQIVYLTLGAEYDENTSQSLVACESNNDVLTKNDSDEELSAFSPFGSGIKIITLEDGRMFMTNSSEDENFETIEPHLLTSHDEIKEEIDVNHEDALCDTVVPDSNYEFVQLIDGSQQMIEMVYCDINSGLEHEHGIFRKDKKFKCMYDGCDRVYGTSYRLTVHMRSHTESKPYECRIEGCGKRFSTNYSLKAHSRVHTGEKPYGCSMCTKNFKTSGDLQKHVRIHTGEKPFMCPIEGCGKSFTTSNIRKVHIRSHTGERPYTCDYPDCGKAFSTSTNYKNHLRIHSGERPYVCSLKGCGKRFTEYSSLYKHNLVHQPDRPFTCVFCGLKFKQESAMNLHKKLKHNIIVTNDGMEIVVDLN